MCRLWVAAWTFRRPWRTRGGSFVRPRLHVAETTTVSKPARREVSTNEAAAAGICCASESSTTPTLNVRVRGLLGGGGGGISAVVVGSETVESDSVRSEGIAG